MKINNLTKELTIESFKDHDKMDSAKRKAIKSQLFNNSQIRKYQEKYIKKVIKKSKKEKLQHPTLISYKDVISYTKNNPDESVYGVYFRTMIERDEISNKIILKITRNGHGKVGKGHVINGVLERDPSAGGSEDVLETLYFIPCKDEDSAYEFEKKYFHPYLKSLDRWIEPIKNSDGKSSGNEWFHSWSKDVDTAIKEFLEIGKKLLGVDNLGLETFKYYGNTQKEVSIDIITRLKKYKKVLFAGFPGWGKTTLSPKFIVEICNPGDVMLFTTPIVDTLEDFKKKFEDYYYGNKKIKVIDSKFISNSTDIMTDINNYRGDGYIVVISLSVQDLRYKDSTNIIDVVDTERGLRKKYKFLLELDEIKMWIRDEFHKEYNGTETSKLFKNFKSTYTLDLTASTVKLLSLYNYLYTNKDMIIRYDLHDMLYEKNVKNNPDFKNRPNFEMESIGFDSKFLSSKIKSLFTKEEGVTSKKLFGMDKYGNLETKNEILEYLKLRLDNEILDENGKNWISLGTKNPYYLGDRFNSTLMVIPQGNKKYGTDIIQSKIQEVGNGGIRLRKFYTASDYLKERKRKLTGEQILEKWLREARKDGCTDGIVLLTHQQLTTGSNIPPLNSMLVLDVIKSIDRFIQLIGRLSREYEGKHTVKVCLDVPEMVLSASSMMYQVVSDKTPDKEIQKELLSCIPHIMYMKDKPVNISFDESVRNFNKDINRKLSLFHVPVTFINKFPDVISELDNWKSLDYLKSDSIPGLELTSNIGSKTFETNNKRTNSTKSTKTKKRNINRKIETLSVILTESLSIYICEGHDTIDSVFNNPNGLVKKFFTEDNIKMVLSTFKNIEFYRSISDWYKKTKNDYDNMSIPEIVKSEQLFINSDFKGRSGLVYIPKTISVEMIDWIESDNSEPESILVVNALNGMLPVLLREKFPNTRIVCVEYFPFYINHLKKMGFETYKLQIKDKGEIFIPGLENNMNFDYGITNPPYTKGGKLLYTYFFKDLLNRVGKLLQLMPVDLKSTHDKLKFHNRRIHKHQIFMSKNVSDSFNVGIPEIRYIVASKGVENDMPAIESPLNNLSLLYPERRRLKSIKGDTGCSTAPTDLSGDEVIHGVYKGDVIGTRYVSKSIIRKSKKWSNSPYLVCINYTPSQGRFNCKVIKNKNMTWTMKVYVFEVDSLEEGNKLKEWLQSKEIIDEINRMFSIKSKGFFTISKEMIDRLPHYE